MIGSVSRRHFIQSSSAIAAAGALSFGSPTAAPGAEGRTRANKGRIYTANKGGGIGADKKAMIAKLEQYKTLGFDGIEGGSPEINDTKALREAIDQTGVPVHGVVDGIHWNKRLSSPNPKDREIGLNALTQAIKDSHAIGGSTVLLVPGQVNGADENHDHVWNRSIVEIRKALPLASRLGIQILIENVWNGFCEKP